MGPPLEPQTPRLPGKLQPPGPEPAASPFLLDLRLPAQEADCHTVLCSSVAMLQGTHPGWGSEDPNIHLHPHPGQPD